MWDPHDVVVGSGEQGLGQPLEGLVDASDLRPLLVLDDVVRAAHAESPDHPDAATTVRAELEAGPAEHVLLDDPTEALARRAADDEGRPHQRRGPLEAEHGSAGGVGDLELVAQEPVDAGDGPEGPASQGLVDLPDRTDLDAVGVVDHVLVGELDELGLLVDDQDVGVEQPVLPRRSPSHAPAASHLSLHATPHPPAVRECSGDAAAVGTIGIDPLLPASADAGGPRRAVEPAVLEPAVGVGEPACLLGEHPCIQLVAGVMVDVAAARR